VGLLWPGTVVAGLLTMLAAALTALVRIPTQPRPPSSLGWLELLSGVAAPVAALVGLGVLLYWASIYYIGPDKDGDFSCAALDGVSATLPLFLGATLLTLVVAIGAALHALQRDEFGRALLWLTTLLLAGAWALAFAGVDAVRYLSLAGPSLVPTLALSALASLAALAPAGHDSASNVVRCAPESRRRDGVDAVDAASAVPGRGI
jgi:hypothetical protein